MLERITPDQFTLNFKLPRIAWRPVGHKKNKKRQKILVWFPNPLAPRSDIQIDVSWGARLNDTCSISLKLKSPRIVRRRVKMAFEKLLKSSTFIVNFVSAEKAL